MSDPLDVFAFKNKSSRIERSSSFTRRSLDTRTHTHTHTHTQDAVLVTLRVVGDVYVRRVCDGYSSQSRAVVVSVRKDLEMGDAKGRRKASVLFLLFFWRRKKFFVLKFRELPSKVINKARDLTHRIRPT